MAEPPVGQLSMTESARRRIARGGAALAMRQLLVAVVATAAGVVLARRLSPGEFGLFGVIVLVMAASRVLVESGIAAATVRMSREPSREQLSAAFGAQLALGFVGALGLVAIAPLIGHVFDEVESSTATVLTAAAGVPLIAMTSAALVRLERSLRLAEVGVVLAVQPLVFYCGVIAWIAAGGGAIGIGLAFVASNLAAIAAAVGLAGRVPRPTLRWSLLAGMWRFALLHWAQNAVSVIKDTVNPLVIGSVVGAGAAGYVNWAQQLAVVGAYLAVAFSKLLFPVFSRVAREGAALTRTADLGLRWLTLAAAPPVCAMVMSVKDTTVLIYGPRWEPAIGLVLMLAVANVLVPASLISVALLNALGHARETLVAALGWMAMTWVGVVALVAPLGRTAYGVANLASQLVTLWLMARARRLVPFAARRNLVVPWLACAAAFGAGKVCSLLLFTPQTWVEFGFACSLGATLWLGVLATLFRADVVSAWRVVRG